VGGLGVRAISSIPNTIDYLATLKHFKSYYCEDKIGIKKELKTQTVGYELKHTRNWKAKQ